MRTSTQIRCSNGACSRMCYTRAQQERSVGAHVAALGLPLLFVQKALADVPRLDDLQGLSYDSAIAPKAAVKAAAEATNAVSKLDAVSGQDATPLIAGLAVGIAIAGGAIAYFAQPNGPRIQTLSCKGVLKLLEEDPEAQLIDIRPKEDLRETGSPDLRSVKKSPINVAYKPMVEASASGTQQSTITIGWAERLCRNPKVGQERPVVLLDTDGSAAGAAARELALASPERPVLYTVAGGAEAWLAQELPWKEPLKLAVNFESLKAIDISGVAEGTEKLVEKYRENPTVVNGGIAAMAVAGASVFLFTEVEAILQVVGVVVALQFLSKRLLFAEDRQQTFNDLKTLISDKIAAGQAGEDLKRLAEKVLDAGSAEGVTEHAAAATTAAPVPAPAATEGASEASAWIKAWEKSQALQLEGSAATNGSVEVGTEAAGPAAGAEEEETVAATEKEKNVAEAEEWIAKYLDRQA
eukprot:jgi/Ulvmu1/951/UM102_0034.1